ncbi:HAD family hydrolase [Haloparvum sp. AD34]
MPDDSATDAGGAAGDAVDNDAAHYDAVFWDIGGVILDLESVQRAHERFVDALVDQFGAGGVDDATPEPIDTWRSVVGDHFREREGNEFRAARDAYDRANATVVGREVPRAEWRALFDPILTETIRPNPTAVATIERLAASDLHVGVVSDVDTDEGHRILETFGVRDRFDAITTSEAVGRTKPAPAMFETALSAADVDPDRALMVGDRYDHDVAGAKELGLDTVAYGADDGPAVDYAVEELRELLAIVGVDVDDADE